MLIIISLSLSLSLPLHVHARGTAAVDVAAAAVKRQPMIHAGRRVVRAHAPDTALTRMCNRKQAVAGGALLALVCYMSYFAGANHCADQLSQQNLKPLASALQLQSNAKAGPATRTEVETAPLPSVSVAGTGQHGAAPQGDDTQLRQYEHLLEQIQAVVRGAQLPAAIQLPHASPAAGVAATAEAPVPTRQPPQAEAGAATEPPPPPPPTMAPQQSESSTAARPPETYEPGMCTPRQWSHLVC